jgi:hypothetical protein
MVSTSLTVKKIQPHIVRLAVLIYKEVVMMSENTVQWGIRLIKDLESHDWAPSLDCDDLVARFAATTIASLRRWLMASIVA